MADPDIGRNGVSAEILYVDMWRGECIQEMKLAGILRYAAMRGWNVTVLSEEQSRPARLARYLAETSPVGCIVECSAAHRDLPPRLFGNVPVVYLDAGTGLYGGGISKVVHDGESAARAAFRELSSNRPESYAIVGFRLNRVWPRIREQTFMRLAKEADKKCRRFEWRDESAQARAERLSAWIAGLPQKCAVFAVNDETAFEVLEACRTAGRRVPSEMTLLGIDNREDECESSNPRLTSVQIDFERAGYRAAALLDGLVSGDRDSGSVDTYGPLLTVRRESTRGVGRCEPRLRSAVELIRRDACNGLTAADVVNTVCGSRRLAEIRFREAMGHSILDEIQHVRMEKVYFLLSMTDTPIGAVAAMCGYRSEIALHKYFKSVTGMCMREWRRRNRKR